jgi:hypothetical protein
MSTVQTGELQKFDWIVFYWMPYDNNLWRHEASICDMLVRGIQSADVLAVVVSDLLDEEMLRRRLITKGHIAHQEILAVADSSSAEIYADNLEWLGAHYHAQKWVIVFLGHGGRLDEISPDYHPHPRSRSTIQWMNIEEIARVLENFSRKTGRIELLFLQNCCKATLEALYTFRRAARYTLASQTKIGAPNYYYEGFFQSLGQNPNGSGMEIGERLVSFEREDMYNSFALVDNTALCELSAHLDPLINAILSRETPAHLTSDVTGYEHMNEYLVDLLALFRSVVSQTGADQKQLDFFEDFVSRNLILRHMVSPDADKKDLSGISVYFPSFPEKLDQYRHLGIYSDTRLAELFDVVMPF